MNSARETQHPVCRHIQHSIAVLAHCRERQFQQRALPQLRQDTNLCLQRTLCRARAPEPPTQEPFRDPIPVTTLQVCVAKSALLCTPLSLNLTAYCISTVRLLHIRGWFAKQNRDSEVESDAFEEPGSDPFQGETWEVSSSRRAEA